MSARIVETAARPARERPAMAALALVPELVITDFVAVRACSCPQRNLGDGDARCASVAAAAIVAQVTRPADARGRRAVPRLPPNNAVGRAGPVG